MSKLVFADYAYRTKPSSEVSVSWPELYQTVLQTTEPITPPTPEKGPAKKGPPIPVGGDENRVADLVVAFKKLYPHITEKRVRDLLVGVDWRKTDGEIIKDIIVYLQKHGRVHTAVPETYVDMSDTQGDRGSTFHLDVDVSRHPQRYRDRVWGEPWEDYYFNLEKVRPELGERIDEMRGDRARASLATVETPFTEDYMTSPVVDPAPYPVVKRRRRPNVPDETVSPYFEQGTHSPLDDRKRNPTPYGRTNLVFQKTAEWWFDTFYTFVKPDFIGPVITARDQGLHPEYVLLWDEESILDVMSDLQERMERITVRIPPMEREAKWSFRRFNPNVYAVLQIPVDWIVN